MSRRVIPKENWKKSTCKLRNHPNKEYFVSLDDKSRFCIFCKVCNRSIGVLTIIENTHMYDEKTQKEKKWYTQLNTMEVKS